MKLVWTQTALDDLARIGDFIARDDPAAARRFVGRLWKRAVALKRHPRLGRVAPEIGVETIRELIEGGCRILYRVDADAVLVLTVFERRRLLRLDDPDEQE